MNIDANCTLCFLPHQDLRTYIRHEQLRLRLAHTVNAQFVPSPYLAQSGELNDILVDNRAIPAELDEFFNLVEIHVVSNNFRVN